MLKKKPSVSHIGELRFALTELWDAIKNDEIPIPKAKQLNSTATNIIKSVMAEDFHGQVVGEIRKIDFMETGSTIQKKTIKRLKR